MAFHSISNLHSYNVPSQNGGSGPGFGPLITVPAGNWEVSLGLDAGPGTIIQLRTAAGVVLCQGPGGHRGGALNFGSPTAVQFVVSGGNLALVRGSGGALMASDGRNWSE
jgi:hypothetical protein